MIKLSHSVAMFNLTKSKETTPTATTALKVAPLEDHFHQELKSPFRISLHKFFKNCSYEVNLAARSSHSEVLLLGKFWSIIPRTARAKFAVKNYPIIKIGHVDPQKGILQAIL